MMNGFDCLEATYQRLHVLAPGVASSRRLVVKLHLGLLAKGLNSASDLILGVVQVFQETDPNLQITLAGCGQNDVSGDNLFHRSGLAFLAAEQGWDLVDLAVEPVYRLREPRLPLPLAVPHLAFTDHVLVSIAPLATHPLERLSGMLANQLDLFPDALQPDLWPLRYQAVQLATRVWSPDLCVLDARHVHCWHETKQKSSVKVEALDTILIGHDPWGVDRKAAHLLGLFPQQVPMLRHGGKRSQSKTEQIDVIQPAHTQTIHPPLPSPYSYGHRIVERVQRTTWRLNRAAARVVDLVDPPRWVDFLRRARGLEG